MQISQTGTSAMRKPKAPDTNRTEILAAAVAEFALHGFKGASMDAIAARTSITRALINYYYGGKEKLYVAALDQVYTDIRDAEHLLDVDNLPPTKAIDRIVEFTYNYYVEHEDFVRLVVAENRARGRQMKKSSAMRAVNRRISEAIAGVLARGQDGGVFRKDVHAIDVHMAIAALSMFNITNQCTFSAICERATGTKRDVRCSRRVVADIVLRWLAHDNSIFWPG